MSENTNRRAFTLIELLVVIAIIAILAAILFPVFAKSRERAKATDCIAHLKQFGLAFRQYCDDNDGHMPTDWRGVPRPGSRSVRAYPYDGGPIWAYINTAQVYYCPSDPWPGRNQYYSYGYDWNLFTTPKLRLDQVPVTPIPNDPKWGKMNQVYILDEWAGHNEDRNKNGVDDDYERHGKGCNVLMSDAHVKFIKGYNFATGEGTH